MLKHNFLTYSGKIIIETLGEIVYFPLWWYSFGFAGTLKKEFAIFLDQERALGFSVWLKNIFVPMYGQYDTAGRIISFFIRLVQVIFRGLALLVALALLIAGALFWLILPLFVAIALIYQVSG